MKLHSTNSMKALLLGAALTWAALPACQHKDHDDHDHATHEGHLHDDKKGHDHGAKKEAKAGGGCPHAKAAADKAAKEAAKGDCGCAKHAGAAKTGGCPHAKKTADGKVECGCKKGAEGKADCKCPKGADGKVKCDCAKHGDAAKTGGCPHAKKAADGAKSPCGGCDKAKVADKASDTGDCGGGGHDSGLEAKAVNKNAMTGVPIANSQGPIDEKLGKALAGAKAVTVAELLKNPDAFDGKTVRLEGQVTDMCFHRRGWFGISDKEGKKVVRVVTGKAGFQVPEGAIGAQAKAEGKIKVVTLDPKQIAHYKKLHKFVSDKDAKAGKSIRQPIILASGAEFKR